MTPSAAGPPRRRDIIRACKTRGWTLQPAVLAEIEDYLGGGSSSNSSSSGSSDSRLSDLLDVVRGEMTATGKAVTESVWKRVKAAHGSGLAPDDGEYDGEYDEGTDTMDKRSRRHWDPSTSTSTSTSTRTKSAPHKYTGTNDWHVVNAFQTPRLVYLTMRKQFLVEEKNWSLLGTPEDKVGMLAHRYALIHQRILRHELFRPTDLGHSRSSKAVLQHKLTPVESLLGKSASAQNAASSTLLLLGILIQIEEGHYYLEDPSGQVLLSFQDTVPVDGFFVTEHCILLVEGTFQDGILYVQRMGHPLLETRETSLESIQQQVFHPSFALRNTNTANHHGATTMPESDSSIVLLADVHLDQPRVLQQLEGLFATYENYSPYRLPLFCLQGNFLSTDPALRGSSSGGSSQNTSIRQALEELAALIAKYPNLARNAHFVLQPGPNDGVGHVLPLPPLTAPASFGQKVTHVHWGSNPTRITWSGREMVVFRYDLLHLLQREQVLLQDKAMTTTTTTTTTMDGLNNNNNNNNNNNDDDDDDDARHRRQPHCRLVKTVLDQGHLVPVQGVPVYWNYDHALSLYPLPDALVLAGDASSAYHEVYGGCDVIHPGSLAGQGSFAVYSPTVKDRHGKNDNGGDGDDDDDDDDSIDSHVQAQRVELCQLGDENGRQGE